MEMLSQRGDAAKITLAQYVLLAWFFLALGASLDGLFLSARSRPPLALGLSVVVPILLFFLLFFLSSTFRRFARSINPVTITALQSYRVLGAAMLILYSRNMLPAVFALPAGWGDVAIGVAAPLVALALATGTRSGKAIFLIWNILGILDLVVAVGSAVLVQIGFLASTISVAPMSVFPMSLIPTFLVPLSILFHLIGLNQLRTRSQA